MAAVRTTLDSWMPLNSRKIADKRFTRSGQSPGSGATRRAARRTKGSWRVKSGIGSLSTRLARTALFWARRSAAAL